MSSTDTVRPQIIVQDVEGQQRALDTISDRLLKGVSWKKARTVVIIPAADMIPAQVALSWMGVVFPPNQGVVRILAQGMEVGDAYSQAIEMVLAHPELRDWEYIATWEHDNTVPADGMIKLMEEMEEHPEYAAISALYAVKGHGSPFQVWGDIKDPQWNARPQVPRGSDTVECYGIGMGCALWRMSMFRDRKLARPLFKTYKGDGGVGTQDLMFCRGAREHGYRFAVSPKVRSGHVDITGEHGEGKGFVW